MTQIRIYDLRLSFIWVETLLDLIRRPEASTAPLTVLGRSDQYIRAFEQAQLTGTGPKGLQVPWERQKKGAQFFWSYYLEKRRVPGYVSGGRAWKALVPFRRKILATSAVAPWLGRLTLEAFFYPYGLAFIVTAICHSNLTLREAVEKAFEVRRTGRFQVEWEDGGTSEFLSLDAFAVKEQTALRKAALGPGLSANGGQITLPFTIVTVVRGAGVDAGAPTPEYGEVHRALEAMTTWRPTWPYDDLPSLDEASLQIRTAPPSHVLYGHTRGRAVWFPGLFVRQDRGLHSLSCYHRNLLFVSLQVESLGDLVSKTAEQIRAGMPPSAASTHHWCAKRAAGILSRLYGGHEKTYRSWSARAHIEQNALVTAVNEVREYICNLGPLSS